MNERTQVNPAIYILLTTRDISCVCFSSAFLCVHVICVCSGEGDYKESDRK